MTPVLTLPLTPPQPVSLEDGWSGGSGFRLVLPRAKRDRLQRRAQALVQPRHCSVVGCGAESMAVLLVDSEDEAVLCPRHQLVQLDGRPVQGQPMLATAGW
jgi:hypothetical protein